MQVALKKILPVEQAVYLNKGVIRRIQEIDAEREKYAHKALEKHFSENILPILALYLVLLDSEDLQDDKLEMTRKIAEEMYLIGRKRMAFLGRFPFFFWLIKKMTPSLMKSSFPSEGWDIEWLEVSKKRVAFNMHACFYCRKTTAYGSGAIIGSTIV